MRKQLKQVKKQKLAAQYLDFQYEDGLRSFFNSVLEKFSATLLHLLIVVIIDYWVCGFYCFNLYLCFKKNLSGVHSHHVKDEIVLPGLFKKERKRAVNHIHPPCPIFLFHIF